MFSSLNVQWTKNFHSLHVTNLTGEESYDWQTPISYQSGIYDKTNVPEDLLGNWRSFGAGWIVLAGR